MTPDPETSQAGTSRLTAGLGLVVALGTVAILFFALQPPSGPGDGTLPDFTRIDDPEARKEAFLEYLLPVVDRANDEVLARRGRLETIHDRHLEHGAVTATDRRWLAREADRLDVTSDDIEEILTELRRRLDIVPPSLALAQAALESGWGTSRFAREGSNLFGHWCYVEGCGLIPERRPAGARHEVAVFDHPAHAVRRYLYNLNTHLAYQPLRDLRAAARAEDRSPGGLELTPGLAQYSERGEPYVREVQITIRANALEALDER